MAIYSEDEDPNIAIAQGVQIKYSESEFKEVFNTLRTKRFLKIKDLNHFILNRLGFNPKFEKKKIECEDDFELDNRLISNCTVNGEDLCYLDVYYLTDNLKQMYVTEVQYDFST